MLTGVCLTPGDQVEVAGADGFKLAWETVRVKLAESGQLIIPARPVEILARLWKKEAAP